MQELCWKGIEKRNRRTQLKRSLVVLFSAALLCAQPAAETREVDIAGDQSWVDTGLDLRVGASLRVAAAGSMQFAASAAKGPDGLARGWKDLLSSLPVNEAGR